MSSPLSFAQNVSLRALSCLDPIVPEGHTAFHMSRTMVRRFAPCTALAIASSSSVPNASHSPPVDALRAPHIPHHQLGQAHSLAKSATVHC